MDTDKQIAAKGAKLLWPQCAVHFEICTVSKVEGAGFCAEELLDGVDVEVATEYGSDVFYFSPANNANDMNKLIEALKIDVYYDHEINEWWADNIDMLPYYYKSRDEAIRECVIKALGINQAEDK